jgi:hypothetical protein
MRQHRQRTNHWLHNGVAFALPALLGGLLSAASVAASGPPHRGCGAGFELGSLTFAASIQLPRIQAALQEGIYDAAEFESLFGVIDQNGDGLVCFQDVGALNDSAGKWQFFYNAVDNNSAHEDW